VLHVPTAVKQQQRHICYNKSVAMIFVFAAELFFFFVLFWNAAKFNRMAEKDSRKEKR
jgi:hypothetical protein